MTSTEPTASAETVQDLLARLAAAEAAIRDQQVTITSLDTRLTVMERFMADRFR